MEYGGKDGATHVVQAKSEQEKSLLWFSGGEQRPTEPAIRGRQIVGLVGLPLQSAFNEH